MPRCEAGGERVGAPGGRASSASLQAGPSCDESATRFTHTQRPHAEVVAREGAEAVTHESLVASVRAAARAKVPDHLKAELLRRIREILEA